LRGLIVIVSTLQLMACSSICLVPTKKGSGNAEVYTVSHHANTVWLEALETKLAQCDVVASERYSQGNIMADFVPSPINSSPSCLLRKAKNNVVSQHGSLVLVEYYWYHFEAGLQYNLLTYECPDDVIFVPEPNAAKHDYPLAE